MLTSVTSVVVTLKCTCDNRTITVTVDASRDFYTLPTFTFSTFAANGLVAGQACDTSISIGGSDTIPKSNAATLALTAYANSTWNGAMTAGNGVGSVTWTDATAKTVSVTLAASPQYTSIGNGVGNVAVVTATLTVSAGLTFAYHLPVVAPARVFYLPSPTLAITVGSVRTRLHAGNAYTGSQLEMKNLNDSSKTGADVASSYTVKQIAASAGSTPTLGTLASHAQPFGYTPGAAGTENFTVTLTVFGKDYALKAVPATVISPTLSITSAVIANSASGVFHFTDQKPRTVALTASPASEFTSSGVSNVKVSGASVTRGTITSGEFTVTSTASKATPKIEAECDLTGIKFPDLDITNNIFD
jgi:hypothetical protein